MLHRMILAAGAVALGSMTNFAVAQEAKPRVVDIEWPSEVIGVEGGLKSRLPNVDATLLPVLVPRAFFDYKSLAFVGQPLEYAASVQAKGASISIVGTRIAVDVQDQPALAEAKLRIEATDQGITAAFEKYGAAYLVTIECAGDKDTRCTGEDYIKGLVAAIEPVGGGRASAPALTSAPASSLIGVSADPAFKYDPAGQLYPANSGQGVTKTVIYAPNIRFPVEAKPAYLNSQVYGWGGYLGPNSAKGWRDLRNYAYPWRDNFCEIRGYKTDACPTGTGHQGVDIRPADPADQKHLAVAVEAGKIVHIGTYMVTLAGSSGNHYNYLHLEMAKLRVKLGDRVTMGQPIGLISNDFGREKTSVHLHFEIRQNLNGRGWRPVPPYSSLVAAYKAL